MEPQHFTAVPFATFKSHVEMLYKPPLRARATWVAMRQSLSLLGALPGVETTADITTSTIAKFVASRDGKHVNTTAHHLRKISAACSIAAGEGWLYVNPFLVRRRWIRGVKTAEPRTLSVEEMGRVLDLAAELVDTARSCDKWKARRRLAIVSVLAYTGLRKMECLRLRVEDVDFRTGMIHVVSRVGLKTTGSEAPVPMPPALQPTLRGWLTHLGSCPWLFPGSTREGPWVAGALGKRPIDALRRLGEMAGIEGLTFQSFRHSFATAAEGFGLSVPQIQRCMRHTGPATQNWYRHADLDAMRASVAGIDFRPTVPEFFTAIADVPLVPVEVLRAVDQVDPAFAPPGSIEWRPIPGFPRFRMSSSRVIETDSHPAGKGAPGPWRRVKEHCKGGSPTVNLRRDGIATQRTIASLYREVFGD